MSCEILTYSKISDKDFLEAMIKHHKVATNMSRLVLNTSEDDYIQDYARRTISNQENETHLMERLLKGIPNLQSGKSCNCANRVINTRIEESYPNIFSNLKCNSSHFTQINLSSNYKSIDNSTPTPTLTSTLLTPSSSLTPTPTPTTTSNVHMASNHPTLSDDDYVSHMVSHHKTGVELAKLVIRSTIEPKILHLAQTIVLDQEKEMFMLINLNNCIKYNWRKIIN